MRFRRYLPQLRIALLLLAVAIGIPSSAQNAATATNPADSDVPSLLRSLQQQLQQTQAELARAQARIDSLQQEVSALHRSSSQPAAAPDKSNAYISAADVARHAPEEKEPRSLEDLRETDRLLKAEVEEQNQTKVESASRFRVKISGLVLMNAYSNHGAVDIEDLPNLAYTAPASSSAEGSLGFTLRQTMLGLNVFGPNVAGAQTSADVSVDFFGGFPAQPYGTTAGILRLREAAGHLDWRNDSLTFGQMAPFMSPLSPTSYATLAEPALSWSGNLWVWTPQVVLEHRIQTSDNTYFSVSGGVLAPLTEQVPNGSEPAVPGAGEHSRRPAFGSRVAWNSQLFGRTASIGVGGYVSRLRYDFGRQTGSWAATGDWRLPLGSFFELSGEAYSGLAVGGLGGGIWQSVVYNGDPDNAATCFRGVHAIGGWTQLKFRPRVRWEFNGTIGQDNVPGRDLEWASALQGDDGSPVFARNRTALGNVIFRPRSNLLFSVEYRKLWTYGYRGDRSTASHINIGAGVSF